ncbi:anthrax toxin-like adenylyl cyclase domain-containing protein [Pseudomonadota bacterium]
MEGGKLEGGDQQQMVLPSSLELERERSVVIPFEEEFTFSLLDETGGLRPLEEIVEVYKDISEHVGIPLDKIGYFLDLLKTGIIFAIRPISRRSAELLQRGAAGKDLNVKPKTADEKGFSIDGYIPVDQALCKVQTQEEIHFYNLEVKKFLESPESSTHILKDENENEVYVLKNEDGSVYIDKNGQKVFLIKDKKDGKFYREDTYREGTREEFEGIVGTKAVPVKILYYRGRPLTADVDFMTFGVMEAVAKKYDVDTIQEVHPDQGNITDVSSRVLDFLMKKTRATNLVSHGAEAQNDRFPEDNLSSIFFLPVVVSEPLKDGGTRLIPQPGQYKLVRCTTRQDVVKIINHCQKIGYAVSINPSWGFRRKTDGELELNPVHFSMKHLNMSVAKKERELREAKGFRGARAKRRVIKKDLKLLKKIRQAFDVYNRECLLLCSEKQAAAYIELEERYFRRFIANHNLGRPTEELPPRPKASDRRGRAFFELMSLLNTSWANDIVKSVVKSCKITREISDGIRPQPSSHFKYSPLTIPVPSKVITVEI